METIDAHLTAWRESPASNIPLSSLCTNAAFQPRIVALAPLRDRTKLEAASEEHIERMAADLSIFAAKDCEPLLVASIDGRLHIVDGHHRYAAYQRAQRVTVPARVLAVGHEIAAMVAKLANCDGAKLPLHRTQCAEAAWQYLAHITSRGMKGLPADLSTRKVAARVGGVSHSTVARMLGDLRTVDLALYSPAACDPATGWPRWRYIKGNTFRDLYADSPAGLRVERQAERLAKRVADLFDKADHKVKERAIEILLADKAEDEPIERLCEWAEAHEDY